MSSNLEPKSTFLSDLTGTAGFQEADATIAEWQRNNSGSFEGPTVDMRSVLESSFAYIAHALCEGCSGPEKTKVDIKCRAKFVSVPKVLVLRVPRVRA